MKKYILTSLLLGSLALTGCNDAFLNRTPLDELTDENFWKTEAHVKSVANACYNHLIGKDIINYEALGDDALWYNNSGYRQIGSGAYGSDLSILNSQWEKFYRGIRECNYFLENYNRAEAVSTETRERYAAEVKFIRAYQYMFLTQFWGDVPLVTKTLTMDSPELFDPRTPRKDVIDFILNDLRSSYKALPATIAGGKSDFGRITQAASLALIARLALYNERWEMAAEASKEIMDMNYFALYTSGGTANAYRNLFIYEGRASRNASNKETILAFVYNYTAGTKHNLSRELQVPDQETRLMPTKAFVDSYLCSDGKPVSISPLYSEASYDAMFQNRDPRLKQAILSPGSAWNGKADGSASNAATTIFRTPRFTNDKKGCVTRTGFYPVKYCEPTKVGAVGTDDNDIIIFRYAEVLLTYAEAMYKQGKLTQDIVDQTINKLRDRVGMHRMNLTELAEWGLNVEDELRRERHVEMFMEGWRYFDVQRWKDGDRLGQDVKGIKKSMVEVQSSVDGYNVDADGYIITMSGRIFEDPKNYLWSLPFTQMERNPNLKPNNPGWN
ncbi:MAG: RagB/SusD family nutrient uptake outer membrane protein [Bacteroidales bacterium]